ncbi:tRNA (adenine(22)-N(1))-methyltransferase TrmK [Lentilactobacillus senioris]|uniref:tRNA (adenine(22)-N(1))-methyltransferase n=1 Tax=Lentilactobacillus senioris TaxID=931534 RepID=UPI00227DFA15|nr:tRNA (adenine(22)-N(1))-methyltransferase TrmK [Lentilactobacillus senioris]MCY9806798.1 tRNA (adenine(22)-N(1))-methyltransferase TrmK [Lentilactobacillus senioris]
MNSFHLSERLQTVASYVPRNSRLADIGSDHAYLPIHLVQEHLISFAIAGEVAKGPLANAVHEINQAGLNNQILPRLADGLAAVNLDDHVDAITIAGMGGTLITKILTDGKDKLVEKPLLVLQPNVNEDIVRTWLMHNGYRIKAETILHDLGHTYEIIVGEAVTQPVQYTELEIKFGPFLMQETNSAFQHKWQQRLDTLAKIKVNLQRAHQTDEAKLLAVEQEIKMINEVLDDES